MKEINSKVKEIIVEKLGVDEAEVVSEASFASDFGADSLDSVELIMEFEKEFGISIPDEVAEGIRTVGEAVAYIENQYEPKMKKEHLDVSLEFKKNDNNEIKPE